MAGRRKKREAPEEHANHESWVIPYADMLTLLMALFLVMWSSATIDSEKFKMASESLSEAFGTSVATPGGSGVMPAPAPQQPDAPVITTTTTTTTLPSGPSQADRALETLEAYEGALAAEQLRLDDVERRIAEHAQATGVAQDVAFRREDRGLIVTVVADSVLFDSGAATLRPRGVSILDGIAGVLAELPNPISIEGHTDPRPIATSQFPSNWELSTARATSVLRYLVDRWGMPASKVSAAGYADTRPIADNSTPAGQDRNRRVEVVIHAIAPPPPSVPDR